MPRRLEPADGRVLHGAGQSHDAFAAYRAALGARPPLLYMTYIGLRDNIAGWGERLRSRLADHPDLHLVPQVGLSMTKDGSPEQCYEHEVAAGRYDLQIETLCHELRALGRPAFLRIGYEFNGHWNGYRPESFRAAWIRIEQALRRHGLDEVATVWCWSCDGTEPDIMAFHPGDTHVDWWGIDPFDRGFFANPATEAFMAAAARGGHPVMIGECSPRHVGVRDGAASWERWFVPFFAFIARHPHCKAFCYIDWDWSRYPMWADWGDGRIEQDPVVLERWRAELAHPRYLHGGAAAAVRVALGLPAAAGGGGSG